MAVKLKVDLAHGVFEAEGDDSFVRAMHSEFRDYVGDFFGKRKTVANTVPADGQDVAPPEDPDEGPAERGGGNGNTRKRTGARRRRVAAADAPTVRKGKYEPRVNPDLKLPDLQAVYDDYDLQMHKDKVLFFGHYLQNAGHNPFTADQIFTCYRLVKEKPPAAFAKALWDARGVHHFFKFDTFDQITLTHIGETYAAHDLKKKG